MTSKLGRNEPCPCGSGKKYKQCCQLNDTARQQALRDAVPQAMRMALGHHQAGRFPQAEAIYHQVLRVLPRQPDAMHLIGVIALHDHRIEDAIHWISRAIAINPNNPEYYSNLALAQQFDGKLDSALKNCRKALALKPDYADAWYNLHALLLDANDLKPSIDCMERVVALQPRDLDARLMLGVLLDYAGQPEAAKAQFELIEQGPALFRARLDAWRYMQAAHPRPVMIGSRILSFEIGMASANKDGLVMEFGVRNANSIRKIAGLARQQVHGFDSFEGLPEAWHHEPKGSYTTKGVIPEVPANVHLHVGWFEDTLPPFLEQYAGPVRFINVDCDIYSSTKTVLDQLAPRMVPGSVIVFDEYIGNEHWREDEYKAFQEAVAKYGWGYEYLCFSVFTKQAVVRITSV